MRFLLECVGCCTVTTAVTSTHESSSPATPRSEETRSLVSPPAEARFSRRRRTRTCSSAEWRPSLFAIDEDNDGPVRSEKAKRNRKVTVGSRNVQRCSSSSVRVNCHARSAHEFGQNPLPMLVPTFAAASFMF